MINITWGVSQELGLRSHMEDAHAIYQNKDREFFAAEVYDGHGGKIAAEVASEMLTPYFIHAWARELEKPLRERRKEHELLHEAYLAVDTHLTETGVESGTTAAHFYVMEDRFLAANAGDTRVVIGTVEGNLILTIDHKPELPEERDRIEGLGGEVISYGVPRVQGILSVSRALGDIGLKPCVSGEPRIIEGYLGTENDYAVLACDGVWDVLTPQEVIEMVRYIIDPRKAAAEVSKRALDQGSTDNITVIVLDLRRYTRGLERKRMEITGIMDYGLQNSKVFH